MWQMKDIDSCTINTVRKYQQTKTSWLLFYLLLEKGKKDDRENKFLYMDVLHNYFSADRVQEKLAVSSCFSHSLRGSTNKN